MATLPHFNPDDDSEPLHPAVAALRAAIGRAGALLFCTPEYAGALPGSFKNLLDWTVGGGEIYGKPVAWLNVSGLQAPTRGAGAHDSLRTVLGYVGAEIVEPATLAIPVPRQAVDEDGLVRDPEITTVIAHALTEFAAHVRARA
jgi:NAD(P)H-dependent FMN reductase